MNLAAMLRSTRTVLHASRSELHPRTYSHRLADMNSDADGRGAA